MGKPVQECTLVSSGSSKFLMFLYGGLDWLPWFKKLSKHSKPYSDSELLYEYTHLE